MRYHALYFLTFLVACDGAPTNELAVDSQMAPEYTRDWALGVIALTEQISGVPLDTRHMSIVFYAEEFPPPCAALKGYGCTNTATRWIAVSTYHGEAATAFFLAHEIGHNVLYQTTRDSDGLHKRTDWFDDRDDTSIVRQVWLAYNNP